MTLPSRERLRRWLLASLGTLSLAVGVLGIFIPGLPTTVFLLIAAWLWARSCPALESWLRNHPRLGPYLRAFDGRSMSRRNKVVALVMLWLAIGFSTVLVGKYDAALALRLTMLAAALVGSAVILFYVRTLPEPAESPRNAERP